MSLLLGSAVYHLTRLGHLERLRSHVRAPRGHLETIFRETTPPLVTVLVPSYLEEPRVIWRTLLCAALQEYPRRRLVLLIDDPPTPPELTALAASRRRRCDPSRRRASSSLSSMLVSSPVSTSRSPPSPDADIVVPKSDFVLILDADSVVTPDYDRVAGGGEGQSEVGMPSAASSSAVARRPLAQSITSGPVTHADPFHRSTTVVISPPGMTGRMRTACPCSESVIADRSSRNLPTSLHQG